eukprot:scaffold363122_cov45-Prasinocladus_malaysianus.AAC.1
MYVDPGDPNAVVIAQTLMHPRAFHHVLARDVVVRDDAALEIHRQSGSKALREHDAIVIDPKWRPPKMPA